MSRLARTLATLRSEQTSPVVAAAPVNTFMVYGDTLAFEQFRDELRSSHPSARVILNDHTLSVESQQLDEVKASEDIQAQYQDLMDLINPTHTTGSVQVYLLDEVGMAAGHAGSHAALRAVVRASMGDTAPVVAALTSSWRKPNAGETVNLVVSSRAVRAHSQLIKDYLSQHNIATVESFDALAAHIRGMPSVEMYQEEESSSFVHNGISYPLNPIFRTASTKPTVEFDLNKVRWLADHIRKVDIHRRNTADLSVPIIVAELDVGHGREWVIVDGMHRVKKAFHNAGLAHQMEPDDAYPDLTLPAKVITEAELGQPR
jgi:hypothetical protein